MKYVFMTDSNTDIPLELQQKLQIPLVYMPYTIGGEEYFSELDKPGYLEDFYNKIRNGEVSITSSLDTLSYIGYFEPYLKDDRDILFLAFSAKLSSTINNIRDAKKQLLKKYPNRRFEIVDTYSISCPETLLVLKAHEMYRNGAEMEDIIHWIEDNRIKSQVYFMVDDLIYLKRGGRLSGIAATMGTILSLKPIITLTKDGRLVPIDKVKGKKRAMHTIISLVKDNIVNPHEQEVIVLHGDTYEEAKNLEEMLKSEIPDIKSIRICAVGPVIGSHSGPGTLGVTFFGKERPY